MKSTKVKKIIMSRKPLKKNREAVAVSGRTRPSRELVAFEPESATEPLMTSGRRGELTAGILSRIPRTLLATFEDQITGDLYLSVLHSLSEETLSESSTILQSLVAERAAYYWALCRGFESQSETESESGIRTRGKGKNSESQRTERYKFCVYEFNRNLEILRSLAAKNLPAQQVRLLAKRTISVIERVTADPTIKDAIVREIIQEFTVEMASPTKGKAGTDTSTTDH